MARLRLSHHWSAVLVDCVRDVERMENGCDVHEQCCIGVDNILIFASSLSYDAKCILHMHPLLEMHASSYSVLGDAFLLLRAGMRPLLEKALACC